MSLEKKASKRMPTKKIWHYMIEVKEGFVPRKGKVYMLSRKEKGEMYEFIEEKLRKEYIRPLRLPQMAPVFFYPLPLILDIVENIDTKKVFTKLNLRWDYNNI